MAFYPRNARLQAAGQVQTDGAGIREEDTALVHIALTALEAVVASTTGVRTAVTDNGSPQVITTSINNPVYPRNITATSGGTAADIKAVQVIVAGTNMNGDAITETLPVFTVDSATTVTGAKIFKTVTSITIPAHDGTGATTAIGFGSKLGIPYKLDNNTVFLAFLNGAKEGTLPTVTTSATVLESNGMTLSGTLAGTPVDVYLIVG